MMRWSDRRSDRSRDEIDDTRRWSKQYQCLFKEYRYDSKPEDKLFQTLSVAKKTAKES